MLDYDIVIGLEVHCEIISTNKMFSPTNLTNNTGIPNRDVSIIDLGYPGTLPSINKEALYKAIKFALGIGCSINRNVQFDRKHYFYPDLPRGYQITQKRFPLGINGKIKLNLYNQENIIVDILNVQLEEDTGKTIHKGGSSYIDYSRQGTPLIEIVTTPCMKNADEASEYIKVLRNILKFWNISHARMEKGELRCDINISLKKKNSNILGTKCEIKNVNSINNLKKSINLEINRQLNILQRNKKVIGTTFRYDENSKKNILMREKNSLLDYYFIPEYDLPSFTISKEKIDDIKKSLTQTPDEYISIFLNEDINVKSFKHILESTNLFLLFKYMIEKYDVDVKQLLIWINGDIKKYLNKNKCDISDTFLDHTKFYNLIVKINENNLTNTESRKLCELLLSKDENFDNLYNNIKNENKLDKKELLKIITDIIVNNPSLIEEYLSGKTKVLSFFIGEVLKKTKGKADPKFVKDNLVSIIKQLY